MTKHHFLTIAVLSALAQGIWAEGTPVMRFVPVAISINPLNWKLDNTYAPASMNKGSLRLDAETGELETGDSGADAQVFPARGVVVTHAKAEELMEDAKEVCEEFFGPDGRHGEDYSLFYNNLKENVGKRVAAYKANR